MQIKFQIMDRTGHSTEVKDSDVVSLADIEARFNELRSNGHIAYSRDSDGNHHDIAYPVNR